MKIKIILFIFIILSLALGYIWIIKFVNPSDILTDEESKSSIDNESPNLASQSISPKTIPLPASYQIHNVPFEPQAPFANWDHLHDEACEEASLIIVNYYLTNQGLNASIMEDQIQKITSWEIDNWQVPDKDLTVAELKIIAENFYHLNPEIKKINELNDIKKQISSGHIVIVPAAGRLLGNPNFRSPGPIYHMLVVTGYTPSGFITNDVGTKRGLNFQYKNDIFFSAIHDWSGSSDTINSGEKLMLVF